MFFYGLNYIMLLFDVGLGWVTSDYISRGLGWVGLGWVCKVMGWFTENGPTAMSETDRQIDKQTNGQHRCTKPLSLSRAVA